MRILHLSTSKYGGAGLVADRLSSAQQERGYASRTYSREKSLFLDTSAEKIASAMKGLLSSLNTLSGQLNTKAPYPIMTPISISTIKKEHILKFDPGVIHIHNWHNQLNMRDLDWLIETFPTVLTLHDQRLLTGGCHYTLGCNKNSNGCKSCPALKSFKSISRHSRETISSMWQKHTGRYSLVAPSRWLIDAARNDPIGVHAKNLEVIRNPISDAFQNFDRQHLPFSSAAILLLFVAADCSASTKGLDIILEGLPIDGKILDRPFKLIVVGGDLDSRIPSKYKFVEPKGKLPETEIAKLMSQVDLLIVPSRSENSPSVIIEAMLCQLPVLASNVGGIPELFDETSRNDLFHPNPQSFLEKLISLIGKDFTLEELGKTKLQAMSRHNLDYVIHAHHEIYARVVNARR
jgi:glycosyltransferase involved in cell wall biosynthesis